MHSRGWISVTVPSASSQKLLVLSKGWAPPDRDVDVKADVFRNTSLLLWRPRHLLLKKSQLRLDSFPSSQRLLRNYSSHMVASRFPF